MGITQNIFLKNFLLFQCFLKIEIYQNKNMKKILILLILLITPLVTQARIIEKYSDWKNVPEWAKQAFEALLQSDIISGNDDGTLRADRTINRAEFCKILVNATKAKFTKSLGTKFPDVKLGDWFYPYIEIAYSEGWIGGYPDGTFKPGDKINRAEIAKLLTKAFKFEVPKLENPQYWYLPFVKALHLKQLLPYQVLTKNFSPARTPTRGEVFEQLYRSVRVYNGSAKPGDQRPTVTTKTTELRDPFEKGGNFTIKTVITDTGGTLQLKRPEDLPSKIPVKAGEKNITAFQLEMVATKRDVEVKELSLRRIGFGYIHEFKNVWFEINGFDVSGKIQPDKDMITLKFKKPFIFKKNSYQILKLKVDMAQNIEKGHSHRFVLYLPDWLNGTTNEKIDYFPYGGSDLIHYSTFKEKLKILLNK